LPAISRRAGAEAIFGLYDKTEYDEKRVFLDKIAKIHVHGDDVSSRFSGTVSDYYFIETHHCDAFQRFMQRKSFGDDLG
jgi:hypothetical protein